MARAANFIIETKQDIMQILNLIEQAQAIAAARLQEYNSIADKTAMAGEFDWEAVDMDIAEFSAGMTALASMSTLLSAANATALYRFKIELDW